MANPKETNDTHLSTIREAVGIFFDTHSLRAALTELGEAGFAEEELGLLASEHSVRESLGDLYTRTNQRLNSPNAPVTAFVKNESMGDTVHGMAGSLIFAGTTAAGGGAVMTAAILGGALATAITAGAAVGAIGVAMAVILHKSDAEYLQENVDEGHLLLFIRTRDSASEKRAVAILTRHAGYDAKIYEVPRQRPRAAESVPPLKAEEKAKQTWIV